MNTTNDYSVPGYLAITRSGLMPRYSIYPFVKPSLRDISEVWIDFGPKGVEADKLKDIVNWLHTEPGIRIRLSDQDRKRGFKLSLESVSIFSNFSSLKIALDTLKSLEPIVGSNSLSELHFSATNKIENWDRLAEVKNLDTLVLHHLKISECDFVLNLKKLQNLTLSALKQLKELKFIAKCHSLRVLDLDLGYTRSELPSLGSLTVLHEVSLTPRTVADLRAIAAAPNLECIKLDGPEGILMEVESYECFRNHPALKQIIVTGIGWKRLQNELDEKFGFTNNRS